MAYCSSLKKAEIVEIYQKYLDRWLDSQNAVANLCAFLEVEDLDAAVLNAGNEQRLILVAANFRKEVTATVLWLIGHGARTEEAGNRRTFRRGAPMAKAGRQEVESNLSLTTVRWI